MLQRWSNRLIRPLRTLSRRGALLVLGGLMAVTLVVSPMMTRPANAQLTDLMSLGGSFTNGLSSCAIETVGWVICPTMRSIAKLADYGFTYMNQDFLKIDYAIADSEGGTYTAWEIMRNIANGLFVVAFMILIYSQLTGRSSGGYNIKRLLPRLIICAILVNASYFICVICVEFSNIVGDSLLGIMKEIAGRVGSSIMPLDVPASGYQDGTLTIITSSVMSKTGTAWVLLAPVAAVTISIATITAVALVLLIMRKTLVALLILVSPLLFVAYLLPNLERFFFQGLRLFVQLLLLYPILALLLGAGQIVSATITSVGTGDTNYRVTGDSYFSMKQGSSGSAITDLVAAAVAVVPLLGTWFIFKNMSSIMSTAGSRLSATMAARRGGRDDDKNARVTGKATAGAANVKNTNGLGNMPNRRQAFSRNRRHRSLGGSSLTGQDENPAANRAGAANRNVAAQPNALEDSIKGGAREDAEKKLEELGNAKIDDAGELNVEGAVAAAMAAGSSGKEQEKQKTAKDIFNNLNHAHESKDKDRKLNAGGAPAGGSTGGGAPQPSAPSTSYRAPSMAQNNNIVSGTSAPQQPVRVVAVPVQVDGSALLGQQNQHRPPENVSQPPISGTEEKAKARAQKYLFDADREVKEASDKVDILGNKDTPSEPPHTTAKDPDDKETPT